MQKEAQTWWVQAKVVEMMTRKDIDGVFVDMQATSVARENTRDAEQGEEVLATYMEWVDAIVDIEALENDGEVYVELDWVLC